MKRITYLIILLSFLITTANSQTLDPTQYHTHRESLSQAFKKFQEQKQGRIVFLGGSITYNGGWRDSVCNWLQTRFPDTEFDFMNAGIPSMGSTPGAFRFERDVLKNGPVDLLFEEAAVNDHTNFRTAEEMGRGMEGIIRHAKLANPQCNLVLMYFVDPDKMKEYRAGTQPEVIRIHDSIASHYQVSSINLAKEVTDRIDAGEFDWENDFKDLHPSPFGQGVYANSIRRFLHDEYKKVESAQSATTYQLPEPIYSGCYSNGALVEPAPPKPIKGWKLVKNWTPPHQAGTRYNYTKVPMLVGDKPGKVIKFHFRGNAVGIAVAAGPDAGIIEYSIDNSDWQKLDLFTKWSTQLYLPWYYTLATDLKNNLHTLQIRLTNERNPESVGSSCVLRYFFVNEE